MNFMPPKADALHMDSRKENGYFAENALTVWIHFNAFMCTASPRSRKRPAAGGTVDGSEFESRRLQDSSPL
jgi:hypothetical protein